MGGGASYKTKDTRANPKPLEHIDSKSPVTGVSEKRIQVVV